MKIVIDIDEKKYEEIKRIAKAQLELTDKTEAQIIANGTPLPKGHGELIDKDVVLDMMNHGILEEYITVMGGVIPADR